MQHKATGTLCRTHMTMFFQGRPYKASLREDMRVGTRLYILFIMQEFMWLNGHES